ncbi:MAG: cobalt/nickel transport system ATP-binding protein [Methanolobus sp.]|jgi:cobalt/nickel transport system ATP-binding protein|nr:cobalt/nickel transport system ATP-binding protein [Methanolobus sp.]MDK2911318.1 cobalt/nickel transport system ATP-binding protein [Methanolobus sp.]
MNMTTEAPIIELKDISYFYASSKTKALDSVSLKIYPGEKIAILGANGAGKSTLFRHLNGILRPSSGQVLIDGQEITRKNIKQVRQTVGMVFQNPDDQILAPTVEQDVAFGPMNMGLPVEEVERRVAEALELVHMSGFEERSPHHLSGGQKKLVAIAGILAMRPRVVVLDEPTAGLDPLTASQVINMIEEMNLQLGITVILSTHDVDIVPSFAERVYVIRDGRIGAEGTPEEIFSKCDLLTHAHLRMPRIAEVFRLLQESGIDADIQITPSEARDEILRLLRIHAQ